jgi:hypothetical protein
MSELPADPITSRSQAASEPVAPDPAPAPTTPAPRGAVLSTAITLAAALLAGLTSWAITDVIHPGIHLQQVRALFRASEEAASQSRSFVRLHKESARANVKNGALAFGALGGLLGLALGCAGGRLHRAPLSAVLAGLCGALPGAAVGAALSFGLLPKIPQEPHELSDNPVLVFLIYRGPGCALGGAAGLMVCFGVAGGLTRRYPAGPVLGGLFGLLLGASLGAWPSFFLMPWHEYAYVKLYEDQEIIRPVLMHMGLWCMPAAAAGVAYGFGRFGLKLRPLVRTTVGGICGAALGTILYDVIGAILFPLASTTDPWSSTPETRMLARLAVALFTAAGVLLSARPVSSVKQQPDFRPVAPEKPAA